MRSTLLLPSEKPPTLLDIKTALLTYDKVKLLDPDDRDLFPSTGLSMAVGMPPVMSFPTSNPVRRIGKSLDYDNEFSAVIEASAAAIQQGNVSVVRTYQPPSPKILIGKVDLGGFSLELSMLLTLFRESASDPEFQMAAIQNDKWLFDSPDRIWSIAEPRGNADGAINGSLDIPDITFPLTNESIREPLSNIARARIGHTIKLVSFCMQQGFIPHGIHKSHDAILRLFLRNSAKLMDSVSEVDPYWNYRNHVLKVAHDEYIDFHRLDQMSIEDVLALRTVTWGRQIQARETLFDAAGQIARNCLEGKDFDKAVSEKIRDYRQLAAEIEDERSALGFKINCEVGKAFLSAAGVGTAAGAITTLGTGIGAASAIIGAAFYALQKYQELKPISDILRQSENEFKDDLCFGIHNFYDQFP